MTTHTQLRNRIIVDLAKEGESNITAVVSNYVALAIRHYASEPWWFLETRTTITSSSSQEYYTVPSDFVDEDSLTIEVSNNTYPLIKRTYGLLEDWFTKSNVFTGYPTDYAIYGKQIRLYPVPNGAYPMVLSYRRDQITASGSSVWSNEAGGLIRARVEWQLNALRYHDVEAATVCKAVEKDTYENLRKQSLLRQTTGRPRKRRV